MNILIVEDETALAEAVAHILRKAGHSADWVADGQSALDYVRVGAYDLVLLDIMLPKTRRAYLTPATRNAILQGSGRQPN